MHVCPDCGKAFRFLSGLKVHSQQHTEPKYHCTKCRLKFKKESYFIKHQKVHLNEPDRTDEGTSEGTNKPVIVVKRPKLEKKFCCAHCSRRFELESVLKQHMIIHTNKIKYSCLVCSQIFNTNEELTEHRLGHVKNGGVPDDFNSSV